MQIEQSYWTLSDGWSSTKPLSLFQRANFILVFGGIDVIVCEKRFLEIKEKYPNANILTCSTAGEIIEDRVQDNSIVVTAIYYEKTDLKFVEIDVSNYSDSYNCGEEIASQMDFENLKNILVLSDGILVNGDELVKAMNDHFPEEVVVTGGLAADNGNFSTTCTGLNQAPKPGKIVAVGYYGNEISITHGSKGGWDEFGPTRTVTRSHGNVLLELDGKNALELYKLYLGDKADQLPSSALLFPLCIYNDDRTSIVRTILSIDEKNGSMIFAGDIPQDSKVRFMMANFDRLIDGAYGAAEEILIKMEGDKPSFVLMISCIGRKLVLGPRIDEEVEAVNELFGKDAVYAGFYSNGEISPILDSTKCSLHNQTMTITTYSEK